ncbi:hypothetical protein ACFZCM_31625 [Streptomyces rochei]|uniref:hypothetical protein n=1 Tax=Streptomyces rochei TaxID=1928 RepID=UPI0036EDD652
MSDSILVRVTLDAYDFAHPSEKQTQVYVQIPDVARVSYVLPGSRYEGLRNRAWPEVLDVAQEHYEQGWTACPATAVAGQAVMEWLRDDANRDEMQAAWEQDQARRHPVARKLLARVTELEQCQKNQADNFEAQAGLIRQAEARVAELEALTASATEFRVWEPGYGLYVRRAPGTTGFAVMEARRTDKGRRVWTTAGWQYSALLSDAELFCWPDAQTAVVEARRIMPGAVADEGLSGPCDCGQGAVHYTTADCPAAQRSAAETGGAQ